MSDTVSTLDGSTFMVSDRKGDVDGRAGHATGLFHRDTRHLSGWRLTIAGTELDVLSVDDTEYFVTQFFLFPPASSVYDSASFSLMRRRFVGEGMHEDLTVINHTDKPIDVAIRVDAAADFADLFEVKDALHKKGHLYQQVRDDCLVLGYQRESFVRETIIEPSQPSTVDDSGLTFAFTVEARAEWTTCIDVTPTDGSSGASVKYGHETSVAEPYMEQSLEEWIEEAPRLESSCDPLEAAYRKLVVDLASLRFYPDGEAGSVPAAGLPWFMALFGRDSLITSYQALPFFPELAATTLRVLAARQGDRVDDFRDEAPGKILHELRFGELTMFEERPHSPYYGTADATPLFLVLLDETERWTGDVALVRELEGAARAALAWIDDYGDLDGDGYVEYERRNTTTGLENQCWKDSGNSILFADGSQSKLPRATCEIQGYVYDAKRRCARLAREVWGDADLADRLDAEARALKARFNRDFWIGDRRFFALALDGDKRQVDSLTSNIGHLLWSGIVDDDKAADVAEQLMSDRLFSGWGVRTMAVGEGGYNPIEYHNGTVWPHDNSLIAAGLRRYGFADQAASVAAAMIEASSYFRGRLPEVFAGYARQLTSYPVAYPTASSPQAWASGAPLLLLRAVLGLEPEGDRLASNPHLPRGFATVSVRGVRGRWGRADVSA